MKFTQELPATGYLIRSYEPGRITVVRPEPASGAFVQEVYTASLIIAGGELISDWGPQGLDELRAEHLLRLAEFEPEIVLLGTGTRLRFPATACTAALLARGIGVEVMDTAAACRTFNILRGEEREVVAALLCR